MKRHSKAQFTRGICLCIFFCIFLYTATLSAVQPVEKAAGDSAPETPPKRIVSLVPSITEAIYLLGIEDRLVACTTYCVTPEAAKKKEKVGTLVDINVEKVVALKPDLILAMTFTDNKSIEKFRNLGLKVELFKSPRNYDYLCRSFIRFGKLVGESAKAEAIVSQSRKEVQAIRAEVDAAGHNKLNIFWQLGAKPLYAATERYFTNDFILFSGSTNIAGDVKTGIYSRETVVKQDPDVIVIVTMGILTDEEVNNWKLFDTMKAIKNNRIYVLDAGLYCRPTPKSFPGALRDLIKLLHPYSANTVQ